MAEEAKKLYQGTASLHDANHEEHYRLTLDKVLPDDIGEVDRFHQFQAGTLDGTLDRLRALPDPMGSYIQQQLGGYDIKMIVDKQVTLEDLVDPAVIALAIAYTQIFMNAHQHMTPLGHSITAFMEDKKSP